MRVVRAVSVIMALLLAGLTSGRHALGSSAGDTWACSVGDKAAGCTSTKLAPLPSPRGLLAVTSGQDHRIYAIGGEINSTALATNEAYDATANTWTAKASMPTARFGAAAAQLGGRIYVVGGTRGCSPACSALTTMEMYDTSTNTWATGPPMSDARYAPAAAAGPDGRIYVMGGFGLSSVEAYDPGTGHWSRVAPMHTVRFAPAAITGPDGRIYVIGGTTDHTGANDLASVEAYDTRSNTWTAVAPMPTRRSGPAVALGPDGRIYAIGGTNSAHIWLDAVEAYDFATDSWTTLAPMPTPRFTMGAATGSDGRIYTIGGRSASNDSSLIEAYTPPPPSLGAPYNVSASAGNASVTVTWSPPLASGGAATSYVVTAYLGTSGAIVKQITVAGSVTAAAVTGLANGQTYTFTVTARNAQGAGPESLRSKAVTPGTVPTAPGSVQAAGAIDYATVSWTPPATNGGRAITGYTVTAYLGSSATVAQRVQVDADITTASLTGLARGKSYTFTVSAQNALGSSPESTRSNLITLAIVPDAPSHVQATPVVGGAALAWTAPGSDGASPITRYIIAVTDTATGQTVQLSTAGTATSVTVSDLVSGHTYVASVIAVNAVGESVASAPSSPFTLPSAPGVPANLQATAGDQSAMVSWNPPASTGGAPVTGYIVTASDGSHAPITTTSTSTSMTLGGLSNDVTYTVSVAAVNAVGQGPGAVASVTPRNLPPVLAPLRDRSVQYSGDLTLEVSATDAESADHLTLSATGLPSGLTFTDHGNGSATLGGTVEAPAGSYPVVISVSDGRNPAVSRTLTISVTPAAAVVTLASRNRAAVAVAPHASTSSSVTLTARISRSGPSTSGDIKLAAPVSCRLTELTSHLTYTWAATIQPGSATNTVLASCPFGPMPVGEYHLAIATSGTYYQGSAESMLAVYRTTTRVLHAAGTLLRNGASSTVSATAHYSSVGRLAGSLRYVEHRAAGDATVRSTRIDAMVIRNRHVYLQGTATVNNVPGYHFVASFVMGSAAQAGLWVTDSGNHTVADLSFDPIQMTSGGAVLSSRR